MRLSIVALFCSESSAPTACPATKLNAVSAICGSKKETKRTPTACARFGLASARLGGWSLLGIPYAGTSSGLRLGPAICILHMPILLCALHVNACAEFVRSMQIPRNIIGFRCAVKKAFPWVAGTTMLEPASWPLSVFIETGH
jgi:hypothetical protein